MIKTISLIKLTSNCEAVETCQRSVKNCICKKNEIEKHCWEADHNFS